MFFRHSYDKLIYPLLLLAGLAAISYRPVYHLRADMPPDFFPTKTRSTTAEKRALDHKIAWAYWESAQMDIQWKYPHGKMLPTDPPPEFRVDARALGPDAAGDATRQLYWRRLQELWYIPETWQRNYEWDLGWVSDPLTSAGQMLRDLANKMFH